MPCTFGPLSSSQRRFLNFSPSVSLSQNSIIEYDDTLNLYSEGTGLKFLLCVGKGWMVRGSSRGRGEIFCTVQTGTGTHPASCTLDTGSIPGVKRPGRGVNHPPPSCAEVKERVYLFLWSPSGSSWSVLGWTLPLPVIMSSNRPELFPTEYSTLLLFVREVLALFLSLETGCAQIFLHFRQPLQQNVGMVPKSGVHDRFLPHYFQFVIH